MIIFQNNQQQQKRCQYDDDVMRRALIDRTTRMVSDDFKPTVPLICQASESLFKDSKAAKMIKANLLDEKSNQQSDQSGYDGNLDYLNDEFRAAPNCMIISFDFH